jgi:hypothetical protein
MILAGTVEPVYRGLVWIMAIRRQGIYFAMISAYRPVSTSSAQALFTGGEDVVCSVLATQSLRPVLLYSRTPTYRFVVVLFVAYPAHICASCIAVRSGVLKRCDP